MFTVVLPSDKGGGRRVRWEGTNRSWLVSASYDRLGFVPQETPETPGRAGTWDAGLNWVEAPHPDDIAKAIELAEALQAAASAALRSCAGTPSNKRQATKLVQSRPPVSTPPPPQTLHRLAMRTHPHR